MSGVSRGRLWRLAAHASFLGAWELVARLLVPRQMLPPPSAIAQAFVTTTASGELPRQLAQSAIVFAVGFGCAIVTGLTVGALLGTFPALRRVVDPYVNALSSMPTITFVPLAIIWLGLGFQAKAFLTWLVSIAPIIVNVEVGVSEVPPAFLETARAFGCTRWQIFRLVVLRASAPFVVAGVRLGLGRALVGVVVAEMFTALSGLGYMLVLYGNTFRTAELFVPILVLAAFSVMLTRMLSRIERRIAPWRETGA